VDAEAEAARAEAAKAEAAKAEAAARAALAERKAEPPSTGGGGGAGKSIAILLPKYMGADGEYANLPMVIQSALITDFKKYSAFKVLDRETLDRVLQETIDGVYEDNLALVRLGHVTHTDYIITGNIVKTSTGYVMTLKVANTKDGMVDFSHTGTYTLEALENLTGIHKAAEELLPQLGVTLTNKAKQELAGKK
jgi:curli biogenesis system outer membrane secretion channel CsgG